MADDLLIPDDDDACTVALEELLAASGLGHEEVIELVQFGVFRCATNAPVWTFHVHTVTLARRAARLRDDFGLNVSGMALALTYLERIEALEGRLRELESQLPR
ncbi:chaperone modulator CbpM [Synechococcus sp. CS-1332]|uniref:chaperone modulator CbpM n=1 Tax=Synechococcus sp. CS-1332 TaxID=2847972 RepID=UPI00223B2E27|nr:chaperone modulator CbpM [Synechococcus sp. CS-1332]MCT0206769.1 chaperone modulator CbpM [Synechococcus sp. CS-1332]